MGRYVSRQTEVTAVQFRVAEKPWPDGVYEIPPETERWYVVDTPLGRIGVEDGDWIITKSNGNRRPMADDTFEASYESVPKGGD